MRKNIRTTVKMNQCCSILLLVFILLMVAACSGRPDSPVNSQVKKDSSAGMQQDMTTYLQKKYGMEFEVGTPIYTTALEYRYEAKTHPKGQPEIEFMVYDELPSGQAGASGEYLDFYLYEKWSMQGKQELAARLRQVYGDNADIDIKKYEFNCSIQAFKDLNYQEVFKKSHGDGRIYIYYDVFMDGNQFNQEAEAQKAYQIMKAFIIDYGTKIYTFEVRYIDKSVKKEFLKNSEPYVANWRVKHRGATYSEKYIHEIEDKKMIGWLLVHPFKNIVIKDDRDLAGYFDK